MKKLTIILILFSCSSIKNSVSFNKDLHIINLNKNIIEVVKQYKNIIDTRKSLIFISFKKKIGSINNTFYISQISNLSSVYDFYISSYSFIDGVPVIISSKEDGFVSIKNYNSKFIYLLTNYINDDMLMASIVKYGDNHFAYAVVNVGSIDGSEVWKVKNGKITRKWKKHPVEEKVVFENNKNDISNYYRVIKGGRDDRKIKSN